MTRFAFTVLGRPKGKGRPRTPRGGGRPFTPKATRAAERAIAQEAKLVLRAAPLMTGTVRLTIEAVFRVPVSWPKKLRAAALAGEVEYTGKPDRDNIEKLVMDALNGVAWIDDAQVNRGPVVRRYGDPERTDVTVEELEAAPGLKSPAERRREAKRDSGGIDAASVKPRPSRRPGACKDLAIGKRLK